MKPIELKELVEKADIRLNKIAGYEANSISSYSNLLHKNGTVEVGWREACGKIDRTAKIHQEWVRIVRAARKIGFQIDEERVKHKCAYATNAGGFWNSIIYKIKTPQP